MQGLIRPLVNQILTWGTTTCAILTEQTNFSDEVKDRIEHHGEISAIIVSGNHGSDTEYKI